MCIRDRNKARPSLALRLEHDSVRHARAKVKGAQLQRARDGPRALQKLSLEKSGWLINQDSWPNRFQRRRTAWERAAWVLLI
eukprot:3430943-Alexandrium_andersonii.AAC.1